MKRVPVFVRIWLLSFVACTVLMALSYTIMDMPIALYFWKTGPSLDSLNTGFSAAVILSLESTVVLSLFLARLMRGRISRFGEALAIACLASICTYGINGEVLKPFFGVPVLADVMEGAKHSFNFLKGSENSSFPSGHMVLAGAFAGVFMSLRRASVWPLSALLLLGATLLIVGNWHFLSDVVAGAFVGVSTGMLAGKAWNVHSRLPPGDMRQ